MSGGPYWPACDPNAFYWRDKSIEQARRLKQQFPKEVVDAWVDEAPSDTWMDISETLKKHEQEARQK